MTAIGTSAQRWPYLIEIDDQLAGFCIREQLVALGQSTDFAIAEFYILPRLRKSGLKPSSRCSLEIIQAFLGVECDVTQRSSGKLRQHALSAAGIVDVERLSFNNGTIYRFETAG